VRKERKSFQIWVRRGFEGKGRGDLQKKVSTCAAAGTPVRTWLWNPVEKIPHESRNTLNKKHTISSCDMPSGCSSHATCGNPAPPWELRSPAWRVAAIRAIIHPQRRPCPRPPPGASQQYAQSPTRTCDGSKMHPSKSNGHSWRTACSARTTHAMCAPTHSAFVVPGHERRLPPPGLSCPSGFMRQALKSTHYASFLLHPSPLTARFSSFRPHPSNASRLTRFSAASAARVRTWSRSPRNWVRVAKDRCGVARPM
jgi:hypothetical protein